MQKIAILFAATLCAFSASASAKTMSCTSENMSKTSMMMMSIPDGPNKMAMNKEMGMANADTSKGNMRGACSHYMRAQKMGMMKSDGMMKQGM
jgi:hypothetical protein